MQMNKTERKICKARGEQRRGDGNWNKREAATQHGAFVNLKYSAGFWCELKLCNTRRRKDISVFLTIITITGVMCDSVNAVMFNVLLVLLEMRQLYCSYPSRGHPSPRDIIQILSDKWDENGLKTNTKHYKGNSHCPFLNIITNFQGLRLGPQR